MLAVFDVNYYASRWLTLTDTAQTLLTINWPDSSLARLWEMERCDCQQIPLAWSRTCALCHSWR
jgi:hypothetical protein